VGQVGQDDVGSLVDHEIFIPIPYFFGFDYRPFSNLLGGQGIVVSNCDKWFYDDFTKDATEATKTYWGTNTGDWGPGNSTTNSGIINGNENLMSFPCSQVEKMTPYFKDWNQDNKNKYFDKYEDVDALLYEKLTNLALTKIKYVDRNLDYNEDVQAMPDAVFTVNEANDHRLDFDTKVNDHHLWQYHRSNGFTKIGLAAGGKKGEKGFHAAILRINEGNVEGTSLINKAYIKHQFNTTVVTGMNQYPFKFDLAGVISKTQTMLGTVLLPVCLMMGFPIFLFNVVNEKEKRLIEIMKINGLKMSNYWITSFFFNYIFMATVVIFFWF
jgi:hypothetical protein